MEQSMRNGLPYVLHWLGRPKQPWGRGKGMTLIGSGRTLPPEKASTHLKWLESSLSSDKQQFAQARNEARRAVIAAKNAWFSSMAAQAQQGRFGSKEVWKCIRDMQRGRRGLIPSRLSTILDEQGNVCTTTDTQHQRWRRHFTKVLNLQSQFCES